MGCLPPFSTGDSDFAGPSTVSTEAKGVVPAEDVGVGAGKLPGQKSLKKYPWDPPKIAG